MILMSSSQSSGAFSLSIWVHCVDINSVDPHSWFHQGQADLDLHFFQKRV